MVARPIGRSYSPQNSPAVPVLHTFGIITILNQNAGINESEKPLHEDLNHIYKAPQFCFQRIQTARRISPDFGLWFSIGTAAGPAREMIMPLKKIQQPKFSDHHFDCERENRVKIGFGHLTLPSSSLLSSSSKREQLSLLNSERHYTTEPGAWITMYMVSIPRQVSVVCPLLLNQTRVDIHQRSPHCRSFSVSRRGQQTVLSCSASSNSPPRQSRHGSLSRPAEAT